MAFTEIDKTTEVRPDATTGKPRPWTQEFLTKLADRDEALQERAQPRSQSEVTASKAGGGTGSSSYGWTYLRREYVPGFAGGMQLEVEAKHAVGSGVVTNIRGKVRLSDGTNTSESDLVATSTSYGRLLFTIASIDSNLKGENVDIELAGEFDHDSPTWSTTLSMRNDRTQATHGAGIVWTS